MNATERILQLDTKALNGVIFFLALFHLLLGPFTTMCLWNWFAAPVLGAPSIGFFAALGIGLVASDLTHSTRLFSASDTKQTQEKVRLGLAILSKDLTALTVGFVVRFFV